MMTDRVVREILSVASEDYQGLWEVRSQIEQMPGVDRASVPALLSQAVGRLLERKWVRLYRGALLGGHAVPIADDEAERLLGQPDTWQVPAEDRGDLSLASTPAGERAYFEQSVCP